MNTLDRRKAVQFRQRLLAWFRVHRRDLPWRRTHDPYKILVSEIMLQQTQVDRVLPKYAAFLKRFPTVRRLARSRRSSVIKAWSGLGYNNRAVRFHRAAQIIHEQYKGTLPSSFEALKELPGLGAYTARAVLAFAFGKRVAAVDVNHARVIRRIFFGVNSPPARTIEEFAASLVPIASDVTTRGAYAWNHALMDFGALVCKSRPQCPECPMRTFCTAYPAVLQTPAVRRKREPFVGSNRYVRGRIVALLGAVPHGAWLPLPQLLRQLEEVLPVLPARVTTLIHDLRHDGVVLEQRRAGRLAGVKLA